MAEAYQGVLRPDGPRSRTGCVTCRIRKKKCDEQRPACQACQSRQLVCYGFDAPLPPWFISKTSWEDARNSPEAKSLRKSAQSRYVISRKVGSLPETSVDSTASVQDLAANRQPSRSLQLRAATWTRDVHVSPPPAIMHTGANIWQLRPDTLWWDSKIQSLVPDAGSSSKEATRLLMLFMDVIHPISHTFCMLSSSRDRSWMLDRLVKKRSLYCSAISISACFEYSLTQPPRVDDIGICPKVKMLQNKAICDLNNEINEFSTMSSTPIEDLVWAGVQLLDVVAHLETLEIFSMLQGHWEMHHRAARKILHHIEVSASAASPESTQKASIIGSTLSSLPLSDTQRRSLEFCICNFVWIDVLATSTFGARSYPDCAFDYLEILKSRAIKPETIMGCQGWVMAAVSEIARLEQWKLEHQSQMHLAELSAELARKSDRIAHQLEAGIEKLEADRNRTGSTELEDDIRLISIIWAYGAQVLRQATISDADFNGPDMDQAFVNACLQKLEALPTRLVMRTSWPYTIAGSMAISEAQQARFRWILGRAMQEAQPPGISWKGLMVMEECWRLRRVHRERRIGWREGMKSLGVRVILT